MVTTILLILTALGFGLMITGFLWNARTAARRRLDPDEAVRLGRRRSPGPHRVFVGRAAGAEWSDEMSFTELKRGVQDGSWRKSARLQQFVLVVVGLLLGVTGLALLIGWHTRPVGLLVAALTIAYAAVRLTLGFRRA